MSTSNEHYLARLGCSFLYSPQVLRLRGAPIELQVPLFRAAVETLHQEIALARRFAGKAAYFLDDARRAVVESKALQADGRDAVTDPMASYILRFPGAVAGKDVCLVAAYAPNGRVTELTARYIDLLADNGFSVIVCLAVKDTAAAVDIENIGKAHGIVVRQNGGMDFASWATILRLIPEIWGAGRLVFTNDSVIALPAPFESFISRLREQTADYTALTESYQIRYHRQSYFFMLQRNGLQNTRVRDFWAKILATASKQEVIEKYETRLFEFIAGECALDCVVLYPFNDLFLEGSTDELECLNVTHCYWEHLIALGLPFVKVDLLRDNPLKLPILHWKHVLSKNGVDVTEVEAHLSTTRKQGRSSLAAYQTDTRPEWRIILSELNKIRLGVRRRRKARRTKL
jgi:hypothetical protein